MDNKWDREDIEELQMKLLLLKEDVCVFKKKGNYKLCAWTGICGNLDLDGKPSSSDQDGFLYKVMRKWPKASSYVLFPVPGVDVPPDVAYDRAFLGETLTSGDVHRMWEGTYGEARLELLHFCIKYIADKLSTSKSLIILEDTL